MKKYILFLLIALSPMISLAQYRPQHSQYLLNNFLLNPAISGIENYMDLQLSYRKQWTGIEGAPETLYLSFHTPIGKEVPSLSHHPELYNKRNINPRTHHPKPHHGIGGVIMTDRIGPFSRREAHFTYAYHLPITNKFTLAFGTAAGLSGEGIDVSKITLTHVTDPAIINNWSGYTAPTMTFGLWSYSQHLYIGTSMIQFLTQPDGKEYKLTNHYYFTSAYRWQIDYGIILQPSFMLRLNPVTTASLDMGMRVLWKEIAWVGTAYRSSKEAVALAGLYINQQWSLSYAYDLGMANVSQYSNGSHELVLNFRLLNQDEVKCPQNFW